MSILGFVIIAILWVYNSKSNQHFIKMPITWYYVWAYMHVWVYYIHLFTAVSSPTTILWAKLINNTNYLSIGLMWFFLPFFLFYYHIYETKYVFLDLLG